LPGLAAIVLIIGISLDANVLIYERVREKRRDAFSSRRVKHGFARAVRTVIDANLTVLIVAIILFYVSKGAVRGFAATLIVGPHHDILYRLPWSRARSWNLWISRRKPRTLLVGVRSGIFDGSRIRFMGIRRYTFTASAILSLATLLAIATVGMHLGIDFTGGSIIEVRQNKAWQMRPISNRALSN